jgi:CheY-like chemotaxis protein
MPARPIKKLALAAGMNAHLAKPIIVAELYALLRKLLPEDVPAAT